MRHLNFVAKIESMNAKWHLFSGLGKLALRLSSLILFIGKYDRGQIGLKRISVSCCEENEGDKGTQNVAKVNIYDRDQ